MNRGSHSLEEWLAGGSYFDFHGRNIFYRREGRGPTLLCTHGYPTSCWDWHKLLPELSRHFDVVLVDMLGFGLSDKPIGHAYSLFEQTDLHVALLAELGIGEVHLLCHDYGVTVGQELLARAHEGIGPKLASATFLNGGLFPETHRPRPIQRLLASPLGPLVTRMTTEVRFRLSVREVFGSATQPTDEELTQLYQLVARDDGKRALADSISFIAERETHRARWVTAFVDATLPLLIINGTQDPISGEHMLERVAQLRPHTNIVRVAAGHYPQLEVPNDVLRAFLPFVAGIEKPHTDG